MPLIKTPLQTLTKSGRIYFDKRLFKGLAGPGQLTDKVIVFGTGTVADFMTKSLKKARLNILFYCDNNKSTWGKYFRGKKIITPTLLRQKYLNFPIVIASVIYEKEIYEQLKKLGFRYLYPLTYLNYLSPQIFDFRNFNEMYEVLFLHGSTEKINKLYDFLSDRESKKILTKIIGFRLKHYFLTKIASLQSKYPQYFDPKIIKLSPKEVFVDCGGFTGDTVVPFIKESCGKFVSIYSFEPDSDNFSKLKDRTSAIDAKRIFAIKKGVYNKDGIIKFYSLGTSTSGIGDKFGFRAFFGQITDKQKAISINVVSLDNFFKNKAAPTYIKMDVEGAEKEALIGAKNILNKFKPKLAISIYHKPADLWEIPLLIKRINKKYKLYLRHYSPEVCETVCYAV